LSTHLSGELTVLIHFHPLFSQCVTRSQQSCYITLFSTSLPSLQHLYIPKGTLSLNSALLRPEPSQCFLHCNVIWAMKISLNRMVFPKRKQQTLRRGEPKPSLDRLT
jgi:hypothetical protein